MNQVRYYIFPALLFGVFIACFYPSFTGLVQKWEASEDYAHAFFVVPIICYMFYQKKALLYRDTGTVAGTVLVVVALVLYLLSLQVQVPTFIFLTTVLFIISTLLFFAGWSVLPQFFIPILLLFMIIPIPNQLLSVATATLQLRISEISEVIIRLFSVPMLREGNVLHTKDVSFQVIDACSGIRSLISMTTLSVIIGYFTLTKKRTKLLLFFVSIPVAIVINIIRVVLMVLVYYFFELNLTKGTMHTTTGLLLFFVGLVLLFSLQFFMEKWEIKNK